MIQSVSRLVISIERTMPQLVLQTCHVAIKRELQKVGSIARPRAQLRTQRMRISFRVAPRERFDR